MKILEICITCLNILVFILSLFRNFFIIHLTNTSTMVLAMLIFVASIIALYRLYKKEKIKKSQVIFAIVLFLIELVCVLTFTHFDEGMKIKI